MKKILVRLFLALIVLLILGAIGVHLFLDGAIKKAVEKYGPQITKVDVQLKGVNLILLSGSGKVHGLVIGNPKGFSTPSAMSIGTASMQVAPLSLLDDKVVVRSINLQAPEITFETGLNVKENNLNKLLANIEETLGGGEKDPAQPPPAEPAASKKLQVDELIISNAKVNVTVTALGGKSASLRMKEIRVKDLGQGPDGITPAELTKVIVDVVQKEATELAITAIADLSKGAVYMSKELGKTATNTIDKAVDKATKGIGDLFKKKE